MLDVSVGLRADNSWLGFERVASLQPPSPPPQLVQVHVLRPPAGEQVVEEHRPGTTALFMAAAHEHTQIIVLLMEAGAEVSVKGPKGKTAVDVAQVRYGDAEAAKENDEPAAGVVLLEGRTLDDAAFARAQDAGTVAAFEATCQRTRRGVTRAMRLVR